MGFFILFSRAPGSKTQESTGETEATGTLAAVLEKLGARASAPLTDGLEHHERGWFRTDFA